eukprot:GAHX01000024.1.p1 GENE.GAHX01000024.1~~GAHX01000024.1.p1  ORF type:complete len:187 (-),score=29.25 GAHX01000024.1:32-553(-)
MTSTKAKNPMRELTIAKVVINACIGDKPDQLQKVAETLKEFTGQDCKFGKAKKTIRQWDVRRSRGISVYVTLRGEKAIEILKKGICAKEFTLKSTCVTPKGHLNFGLSEHIDLGIKYDPSVGIFGLHMAVVMRRRGQRVADRKIKKSKIGNNHKITPEESREWFKEELQLEFI